MRWTAAFCCLPGICQPSLAQLQSHQLRVTLPPHAPVHCRTTPRCRSSGAATSLGRRTWATAALPMCSTPPLTPTGPHPSRSLTRLNRITSPARQPAAAQVRRGGGQASGQAAAASSRNLVLCPLGGRCGAPALLTSPSPLLLPHPSPQRRARVATVMRQRLCPSASLWITLNAPAAPLSTCPTATARRRGARSSPSRGAAA